MGSPAQRIRSISRQRASALSARRAWQGGKQPGMMTASILDTLRQGEHVCKPAGCHVHARPSTGRAVTSARRPPSGQPVSPGLRSLQRAQPAGQLSVTSSTRLCSTSHSLVPTEPTSRLTGSVVQASPRSRTPWWQQQASLPWRTCAPCMASCCPRAQVAQLLMRAAPQAGDQRLTDTRQDEQDRCITIKSTGEHTPAAPWSASSAALCQASAQTSITLTGHTQLCRHLSVPASSAPHLTQAVPSTPHSALTKCSQVASLVSYYGCLRSASTACADTLRRRHLAVLPYGGGEPEGADPAADGQ